MKTVWKIPTCTYADIWISVQEKIQTAIIEKHSVEDFSVQEALDFSASHQPLSKKDFWEVILKAMVEPAFGAPLSNLSVNMLEAERMAMSHFIREGMDEIVNRWTSGVIGHYGAYGAYGASYKNERMPGIA